MIEQAQQRDPIELWGCPQLIVSVCDCIQMLCKAVEVERDKEYNVGTDVPVTMREQIETIIKLFSPKDHPSQIIYFPEKYDGGDYLMDVENAK